jgi:RNA polymerase sigma-70 factor (ECF subfamily)
MSDTARLVRASQEGDREALEVLCGRHQGRVLAMIRVTMGAELSARVAPEDVLQETLLESSRKIGVFEDRGPGSFYRWVVGIARFKVAEARRAQRAWKRAAVPLDGPVPGAETSPSGRVVRAERADGVAAAIEALPERQRDAVRMRYLEGRSVEETAAEMGCSGAAVKSLVARGLGVLAGALRGHAPDSAIPPTP